VIPKPARTGPTDETAIRARRQGSTHDRSLDRQHRTGAHRDVEARSSAVLGPGSRNLAVDSPGTERGRTRGTPAASLLRHASTAWRWPGRPIIPRRYRPAGTCLACTSARPVAPHPWCRTILGPGARPGRGLDRRTIDRISCGQAPRPRLRDKLTELAVGVAAVDRAEPTPGGPTGGRAVIPPYECRRYWRRAPPGAGDNAEASLVGGTSE